MATDVDPSCYEWSREELIDQGDSEISVSQMLDHGSISFGRFALEPLSWEKRSVFIHNRYQEELEKLRAPGLVAQKKAYFEEYYKGKRARKALQENPCTEPAACCAYSNHISAESMEENQRIIPSEGHETIVPGIEAASTEVISDVDGEHELVELNSPTKFSNDIKNGENFPNSRQDQMLEESFNNHEPRRTSIEDSEHHDFKRPDNKQYPCEVRLGSIFGPTGEEYQRIGVKESHEDEIESSICSGREKTSTEVPLGMVVGSILHPPAKLSEVDKRGENSRNEQLQSWDQNSFYHEPTSVSIEDRKQIDFISPEKEVILRKPYKSVAMDFITPVNSPKILKLKLHNEQKKVNQAVKGHKSFAFNSRLMKHCSVGDFIKTEHKTKSRTVISTQARRDSSQKRNNQISICFNSPNQALNRALNSKYASGRTPGSYDGVHSKVTVHSPFPFATGKRGVCSISVSARSGAKNVLTSSPLPPLSKGVSSILGREKLERSRAHGKHGKRHFFADRQAAHLTEGNASNVIKPLKTRSVNLPTCRDGTDIGTNSDKLMRNKDVELKLVEMMASSTVRDPKFNSKNSPHGDNSLNWKKLRQEKPPWR